MDFEAIPIQIQTPPKEDEIETLPEPVDSNESFEMIKNPDEDEDEEEEQEEEIAEETHDDEIVVEAEVEDQNSNKDHETSLSSDPGSEANPETPKSGKYPLSRLCNSKTSLSRFENLPSLRVRKE